MDIDSDDDYENGGRGGLGSSRGGGNWEEVSKKKDESGSGHTGYLYDRYDLYLSNYQFTRGYIILL